VYSQQAVDENLRLLIISHTKRTRAERLLFKIE